MMQRTILSVVKTWRWSTSKSTA